MHKWRTFHSERPGSRRIVLVRHGKAEPDGRTDFERELAPRGRRDSADLGSALAKLGAEPQAALVSAALRTQQTWQEIAAGAGWSLEPTYSQRLYAAGAQEALAEVRLTDVEVNALVVVGHNPTISHLAADLVGENGTGEPRMLAAMHRGFSTSARAVLEFEGAWLDLGYGMCRLVSFSAPGEPG